MKGFAVLFVVTLLVCLAAVEGESQEQCHPSACIEASKCSGAVKSSFSCPDKGEVCCSLIKSNDRHRCRHFGGECMKRCGVSVQVKRADDCKTGICCILV